MDEDAGRYATVAAALAGHAAVEDAVAALRATPSGGPYRGALAAALIDQLLALDPRRLFPLYRELTALIVIAEADPPVAASWRRTRAMARAAALAAAAAVHDLPDPAAALDEVDELAAEIDEDDVQANVLMESVRLSLSVAQSVTGRDDAIQSEAWDRMHQLIGRGGEAAAPLKEILDTAREMLADPSGDLAGRVEKLRGSADKLPAGVSMHATIDEMAEQVRRIGADGPGSPREPLSANEEALGHTVAGIRLLDPEGDSGGLDEGVEHMRAALDAGDPDHPQRVFHLTGLAIALVRRSEHTNDIAGLPEAERLLVEAQGLLDGPQDSAWEIVHGLLADVRLRLGAGPDSYLDAVDSVRTHVWQVLMQPDAAGASAAAREAAESAVSAAHRCLRANDPAGAVRALDAGRGLALYAATELRSIPDRLLAAGNPGLAGQWREASAKGSPPVTLRRKVIRVLAGLAPGGALLDPPTTTRIRAALAELDLDALVYLVPATGTWPGLAVAVPAAGPLAYLSLPGLRPADSPEVTGYLTGAKRRDTAVLGRDGTRDLGSLDDEFTGQLDVVCDWAWRAAMGPLIEKFVPSLRNKPTHRLPRLALVPMGELGLIPWQAARRAGGEPAIRSVAFSLAASARMLCHSADLRPVAPSRLGMIVGDPDTKGTAKALPGARTEAFQIWESFYHRGRYLGRLPDDGGTSVSGVGAADEVRAWLTATGRAAGGMLHLACHGVVDAGSSHLLLAEGRPLAADELVKIMTDVPERAVGLVVLAACSTGLAAGDYDEAYSLGTAFLAAGVRSVLSTQWTIPDTSTSLLMFMFHHYLMIDRLPVWAALHRAQLWMIDPHRAVPETMPERLRRQLHDDHSDPADVTAWAGFLHGGR